MVEWIEERLRRARRREVRVEGVTPALGAEEARSRSRASTRRR